MRYKGETWKCGLAVFIIDFITKLIMVEISNHFNFRNFLFSVLLIGIE